jgi:hypothetical protein
MNRTFFCQFWQLHCFFLRFPFDFLFLLFVVRVAPEETSAAKLTKRLAMRRMRPVRNSACLKGVTMLN